MSADWADILSGSGDPIEIDCIVHNPRKIEKKNSMKIIGMRRGVPRLQDGCQPEAWLADLIYAFEKVEASLQRKFVTPCIGGGILDKSPYEWLSGAWLYRRGSHCPTTRIAGERMNDSVNSAIRSPRCKKVWKIASSTERRREIIG